MIDEARSRGIARFEARVLEFSDAVEAAKRRTAAMLGPTAHLDHDGPSLREALEALRAQHEDFASPDEQTRVQLDELAASHDDTQRDRYRELFDLALGAYLLTCRSGVIRDLNTSASNLLGVAPRFAHGKPLAAFVDAADTRTFRRAVESARCGRAAEVNVHLKPRGSERAWRSLLATPIERGTEILWVARDPRQPLEQPGTRAARDALEVRVGLEVTLPRLTTGASEPARPALPSPPAPSPTARARLDGVRVLVVDDDEDMRGLLSALLRQHGASTTAAASVDAALLAFDACPPDVVVSDIGMPGRSGLELARALRAKSSPRARLIAVSGFTSPDEVARALAAGFDMHLAKPVEAAELVGVVRDVTTR